MTNQPIQTTNPPGRTQTQSKPNPKTNNTIEQSSMLLSPNTKPYEYTETKGAFICSQIAQGRTIVKICRRKDLPSVDTVYKWLRDNKAFAELYALAQQDKASFLADKIIETVERDDLDPQDKRVRTDAYKWIAAKYHPKQFGEIQRIDVTVSDKRPLFEIAMEHAQRLQNVTPNRLIQDKG